MKCAQVFLYKNNFPKDDKSDLYLPVLGDFDKSTCTLIINEKPTRLILKKDDDLKVSFKKIGAQVVSGLSSYDEERIYKNIKTRIGMQTAERFYYRPLDSNKYYNACLLASVLLLYKPDLNKLQNIKLELSALVMSFSKIYNYMSYVNLNIIIKYRNEKKNISGKNAASECVRSDINWERATNLASKIGLTTIKDMVS